MKLRLIFVTLLIAYSVHCEPIQRSKRSVYFIGYVSNKTSAATNYVVTKGKELTRSAIQKASDAVSSMSHYFTRGKKSIEDKGDVIANKLDGYIKKAQKSATTIFDNIAPEQVDYECSDQDTGNQMTTPQLITLHGYFAESHTVMTEDGYLLTLHRIPHSQNFKTVSNKTVLIQHGFLGSSIDWVIPGPKRSLPYMLSDAGYDVWMTNVRGNTYSKAHMNRPVNSGAFWNFTFHEMAQYDLPAAIDYIQEYKGRNHKIDYIGYSMGTTILFAMLSTKTQYNEVLRAGYTLAPVAYMTEIKSPFKILAKYGKTIETFFKLIGANEFLPRNAVMRYLSRHSCVISDFREALCELSMFVICGRGDDEHFDSSLMPMILGHLPAGGSTKTLAHFAQEIRNNGKFQQFDYGEERNMIAYGSFTPPKYALDKITLPIVMISAPDDWLSSVADAKLLKGELKNVEHHIIPCENFDHLDFMFAKDARSLVYDDLLSKMEQNNQN